MVLTVVAEKTVHARWLASVVRLPAATRVARCVARNLAGRHFVGTIAVVADRNPPLDGPRVLLVRHVFHGHRWGVPGGWVRRREDPAAACVREVAEETGIVVRAVELLGCELHAINGVPVRYGGMTIAYRCDLVDAGGSQPSARSIEVADVRWFAPAEAMSLVTGFERAMIAKAATV
jgi:8-oxo-dGTP pyrophosphatase MutT (NUDIX family)